MRLRAVYDIHASRDFVRKTQKEKAQGKHYVATYDPQRKIDICLACTEKQCKGDCRKLLDKIKPYDPAHGSAFNKGASELIEINGKQYTLTQLAKAAWMDPAVLRRKLGRGVAIGDIINIEEALE